MALRGIIFDMGGTLLDYHPPTEDPKRAWQAMEDLGAEALYEFLAEQDYALPPLDEARAANFAIMLKHWQTVGRGDAANPRLLPVLVEVMKAWGVPPAGGSNPLVDGLAEEAMSAYIAPVQALVRPMPGAAETLAAVQEMGLRIGLISNTIWPGAFHLADLARFDLEDYLEVAFFSADVAAWKPDARVFRLALEALKLEAAEAVYVGDHPYFDVYGAQQAGLRGVWLRSEEWTDPAEFGYEITPDATLGHLPDLLAALAPWR